MSISLKKCFATLPKTERGRAIVLGGDPKGKNFLYCHGTNVIIRDIENPLIVDIYAEHSREVTVAKYAPSGNYIASGDITGKVRIWDTTQKEHILKNEFQPLGGKVRDIDWSPDNTKLVLVGAGREKYGACITYDSGNNVGSITGHTLEANSCSYKPTRPFKIVTSGEDKTVVFLEGPPFKYGKTITEHSNFVNCVRYSPSGDNFISGGADGKAFVFDGKTGDLLGELGDSAHKGGIYALSYNKDGSQVLTVSGDKTAKIWDVATMQVVTEFPMGKDISDMQVGCLWQGEHILSVSLSGYINYLDKNNPTSPIRVIKGHNKPVTSMSVSADKSRIYTGTMEGYVNYWDGNSGDCDNVKGKGHTNQVQGIAVDGDNFTSVGLDDTVRVTSTMSNEYSASSCKLDSQPKGVATKHGTSVIGCVRHVAVMQGGQVTSMPVKYEPMCDDINPDMRQVAVGGVNTLVIYDLNGGRLTEKKTIPLAECDVSAVRYSPDGKLLAEVGSDKNLRVFDCTQDYTEIMNSKAHNARVNDVTWSPDSAHLATCSVDSSVSVWIPVKSMSNRVASFKDAHYKSYPNKIEWTDNNTIVTAGQDCCVKTWAVTY